jgi:O-antigen ligase
MKSLRHLIDLVLIPYRLIARRLAPEGASLSASAGLSQAVYARSYLAPAWRRLVRWSVVLVGFGTYALLQFSMAFLIGKWWWWYVVAFFIVGISLVLAAMRPHVALIAWLVISPFGKYFLRLDFGWAAMPALTFDFVAIYTLAALLAVRTMINRPKLRKLVPGEWLMLGFVGYVAATQIAAADAYTIGGILRAFSRRLIPDVLIVSILYFATKACIQRKEHVKSIVIGMAVFGLLMGIVNWYEHFTGNRWYSPIVGLGLPLKWSDVGKGRASGVFEHVAAPAALIATTFYLAYYLAGWTKRPLLKFLCYAGMTVMAVGAFFTYTRNVYVVFLLFTLAMPLLASHTRVRFAWMTAVLVLTIMIVAPIVLSDRQLNFRLTNQSTLQERLVYASTAVNVIRHNFWFGVGFGNLNDVQMSYVTNIRHVNRRPGGLGWTNISHNTYLTILAEEGIVGATLYFGAVAAFLIRLLRIRHRVPPDSLYGADLVSILFLSSAVFLVSISAASVYLVPYVSFVFWIQFAIAVRLEELWELDRSATPLRRAELQPEPQAVS